MRDVKHPAADRLLVLGDAAGYVEPITGDGMAWAIEDAAHAAELLGGGWKPSFVPAWEAHWRGRAASRRMARLAGTAARFPLAAGTLLRLAEFFPPLGSSMVGRVHGTSVSSGGAA